MVKSIINELSSSTFERAISDVCSSLDSMARQLDKPKPIINIVGGDAPVKKEGIGLLNNVFTHLLRNSMDHGIESAQERILVDKDEHGLINISVDQKDRFFVISVKDDGRGLNLDMLRSKGLELGAIRADEEPSYEQLAALIFESGLSTKEEVTSISGRGVGMDAVKSFIEEKGGDVSINVLDGVEVRGYIHFEIIIRLPFGLV